MLTRPVAGAEVMREQLAHLRGMAEHPSVYILVVPSSVGAYAGCAGGFVIATIDGREVQRGRHDL